MKRIDEMSHVIEMDRLHLLAVLAFVFVIIVSLVCAFVWRRRQKEITTEGEDQLFVDAIDNIDEDELSESESSKLSTES